MVFVRPRGGDSRLPRIPVGLFSILATENGGFRKLSSSRFIVYLVRRIPTMKKVPLLETWVC